MNSRLLLNTTFAVTIFCISFAPSFSQCTYSIPSDAHVFTASNTTIATGADNLLILGASWICAGDTITITSGFGSQTFFLEENAVLKGGGGGSRTVYLKSGALFDAGGGGSQVIFYEDGGTYINCGSVYPTYCQPLTFDYSNAPENGCLATPTNEILVSGNEVKIYPDPADDFAIINFADNINSCNHLMVLNSMGEKIIDEVVDQFPFRINTTALQQGVYFLQLLDRNILLGIKKMMIAK